MSVITNHSTEPLEVSSIVTINVHQICAHLHTVTMQNNAYRETYSNNIIHTLCRCAPNLTKLHMIKSRTLCDQDVQNIMQKLTKLEDLSFMNSWLITSQIFDSLTQTHCHNLLRLDLSECRQLTSTQRIKQFLIDTVASKLEFLTFHHYDASFECERSWLWMMGRGHDVEEDLKAIKGPHLKCIKVVDGLKEQ